MKRYSNIHTINKAKELLSDIKELKEGNYIFKNGIILSENESVISKKYYFDGLGNIYIDKYMNIKFLINVDDKCIRKTSQGDIKLEKGKCKSFKNISVSINRNNSKISFSSNTKNLEYKVSDKDDFKGKWIHEKYEDNLILSYYKEGNNYIWFKDNYGNISDVYTFKVTCLNTRKAQYDENIFYCSGSTVMIDDIEWIVIEDNNSYIKLMKLLPLDEKIEQCNKEKSYFCFYSKDNKISYKWSNSYLNYYLNNIFINNLSDKTKEKLVNNYICNDYYSKECDNEICGGHIKDEIEYNNYVCNNYVESKIRVITYDEYNYIYTKNNNRKLIDGNYWALNSYEMDKGSSIQYGYQIYVLEDYTNKLDVRPIIVLNK